MSRYARRTDTTHAPIRAALRKAGLQVIDASRVGDGFPDLIVHGRQRVVLVECKQPRNKAGRVTASRVEATQTAFAASWSGGPIVMATSPERAVADVLDALTAIRADR